MTTMVVSVVLRLRRIERGDGHWSPHWREWQLYGRKTGWPSLSPFTEIIDVCISPLLGYDSDQAECICQGYQRYESQRKEGVLGNLSGPADMQGVSFDWFEVLKVATISFSQSVEQERMNRDPSLCPRPWKQITFPTVFKHVLPLLNMRTIFFFFLTAIGTDYTDQMIKYSTPARLAMMCLVPWAILDLFYYLDLLPPLEATAMWFRREKERGRRKGLF